MILFEYEAGYYIYSGLLQKMTGHLSRMWRQVVGVEQRVDKMSEEKLLF